MIRGRNVVDRDVFGQLPADISTADGARDQDIGTIYGDLSRLLVGRLATRSPQQLREIYSRTGWKGNANARALHEAAKRWYTVHHPGRLPPVVDSNAT